MDDHDRQVDAHLEALRRHEAEKKKQRDADLGKNTAAILGIVLLIAVVVVIGVVTF